MKQHVLNTLGAIPDGLSPQELEGLVYEYNPNALPPLDPSTITVDDSGRAVATVPYFSVLPLEIDGKQYAVELSSLNEGPDLPDLENSQRVERSRGL